MPGANHPGQQAGSPKLCVATLSARCRALHRVCARAWPAYTAAQVIAGPQMLHTAYSWMHWLDAAAPMRWRIRCALIHRDRAVQRITSKKVPLRMARHRVSSHAWLSDAARRVTQPRM